MVNYDEKSETFNKFLQESNGRRAPDAIQNSTSHLVPVESRARILPAIPMERT